MDQVHFLDRIKSLVIIAMFSDDDLMERLVLKGGNLLDVVLNVSSRGSLDLDFSIEGEFETSQVLQDKISKVLNTTFGEDGYVVFDINVREVPSGLTQDMKGFWGGYKIDFKIIEKQQYSKLIGDMPSLRKLAKPIGERGSPKFKIDISKHEYCNTKISVPFHGYTIYTYSPEMVVCEKLRAVCQQMPEYIQIVKGHGNARARDFLDIHTVVERFRFSFESELFQEIIIKMFAIKRVPIRLIGKISDFREYHRADFIAVQDTVKPGVQLHDFDYYFDYVVEKCRFLESLWNE